MQLYSCTFKSIIIYLSNFRKCDHVVESNIMFYKIPKIILLVLIFYLLLIIHWPGRHAKPYPYISDDKILDLLMKENLRTEEPNLPNCDYRNVIFESIEFDVPSSGTIYNYRRPNLGGFFVPQCKPSFKSAIIVPYRNRKEHLDIFLNYIHFFLQQQYIDYRIIIVEQNNSLPFNRAKLFNIGAYEAMKLGYKCLIFHDVDLLPLTTGNLYACASFPRHMSSSVDTFRYNLPYLGLFGGVVSINSYIFQEINGMSNMYNGWGGEDDDLFIRLEASNHLPDRFSPSLSKYTMLRHRKEKPSENRYKYLGNALQRQKVDGLNTLNKTYVIKLETLCTHIYVNSK